MRKLLLIFTAAVSIALIAALPFLCAHANMLPEVATAYYEHKARQEALTATGPEAELMRMLLGLSADAKVEPVTTQPAFSAFGLILTLGAATGIALLMLLHRKQADLRPALAWTAALAVPFGLIGARLTYCLVSIAFYVKDIAAPVAMLRVWEGGLSLSGALIFIVLAGVMGAKLGRAPVGQVLHALVPGMYVLIFSAAAAARIIGMGYGPEMAESFFTVEVHGTPRLDTAFLLMVAVSLALLAATLHLQRTDMPCASRFALYAFLYGTVMILLESLRKDGHMVWGFVHAEMVLDLLFALLGLMYLSRGKKRLLLTLLLTAVMAGAVVVLEFALDRSNLGDGLLYALYVLVLGGYLAWGLACAKQRKTA